MSLEAAVRIGARRNGADLRLVNVPALAGFAERAAAAFYVLTGASIGTTRDLVRSVLISEKHSSPFRKARRAYVVRMVLGPREVS